MNRDAHVTLFRKNSSASRLNVMCLVTRFCSDFSSFAIFSFLRFLFSYGHIWPNMAILSGNLTL